MDQPVAPLTMTLDLGILLALACAFVANLGFFYKYRGANDVPKVKVMHPLRSVRALYSSKWFTLGMITATASWGLHVAALAMAPMSVIQVSLAAGVVFIAVMADRLFGFEVGRRQWLGLFLTAAGLVLLGMTLPAMHGAHSHFSRRRDDLLRGRPVRPRGPADHGTAHGWPGRAPRHHARRCLGHPVRRLRHGHQGAHRHHRRAGLIGLALSPWLAVAVLASIVAFFASARGLQDGEAVPVIAVTGTAANIAGIAGGIVVFGDPVAGSTVGVVLQALAFVLVIVAAALMPAPVRAAGVPQAA